MKSPVKYIGILLLLVIILPTLFFTTYEIGNLQQNEQMIDSIYTSQLESVIFSINQYSDDVVGGWASKLEQDLLRSQHNTNDISSSFLDNNQSVEVIMFVDSAEIEHISYRKLSHIDSLLPEHACQVFVDSNEVLLDQLIRYIDGGYRKIQAVDIDLDDHNLLFFAIQNSDGLQDICGLIINTQGFIKENLGPKIQAVAQEKFFLSVFEANSGEEVYSNTFVEVADKNIEYKKELWLLPDYQMGIQLMGETIQDLVRERTKFNIWFIVIIDIFMIFAAIFIYRIFKQQVKLAQLKSEFVSNVSHEIRTPVAVINMYSETLEMNRIKDEEKKQAYYHIIKTEANRLSGIVNKILNFSRIEGGKRAYKFEESDLNIIIEKILQNYEHHFKLKGFTCNYYPENQLPKTQLDSDAITDAVINLIDNGMKYSADKKQLDLFTGYNDKNVFVEVKDYGIGIEEKYQKMVFDKFYRVTKGNLAHKAKGSGIGLSIVKHIMLAHKGSINLISREGEGSRFILNFPRVNT